MEKLFTRKEAAKILGISIATLDTARNNGLISYVQYVQNGCVYFTDASLQEYIAKFTHRAKPVEKCATYRKARSAGAGADPYPCRNKRCLVKQRYSAEYDS